ncbi:hypothetical protein HAX54_032592 [Datura stramonium]|uniref:Uncharacterized protein n=1 Tax=Datura stramonium TaxID=4076 RepID=A0ABS8VE91_DATST|nr:hypothetical protein [Datura stramonium]
MQNASSVHMQVKLAQFLPYSCGSPALRGSSLALHSCSAGVARIISTSRFHGKGKSLMSDRTSQVVETDEAKQIIQLHFGLDKMDVFYMSFEENQSITAEAQFEMESIKNDFLDIYNQVGIHDWGPFIIPVDPYFH